MFNTEQFLSTAYNEATSTRGVSVPVGDGYPAVLNKLTPKSITTKNGLRLIVEIIWDLSDSDGSIKAITNRDKNTVRQTLWLDVRDVERGDYTLDMSPGMNISLGRLREAVGQNSASQRWSWSQLIGAAARVCVEHQIEKGETYANVSKVLPL